MGVTYQTAHKWFKNDKIDSAYQLSTGTIVVEHGDRLTRFGFHYLEILAELEGFEIIVANKTLDNDKDDLLDDLLADFTAIITSFCARLYSKRRQKHKQDQLEKLLFDKKH